MSEPATDPLDPAPSTIPIGLAEARADSHTYDGIIEHDNPLPLWWLITFLGTIVFGVVYWFHYEGFHVGKSPDEELAAWAAGEAKKSAASGKALSADALGALSKDPGIVAEGAKTFGELCVVCHGDRGEGKIGPNLTDESWLHGAAPDKVYASVSKGIPAKGMPSWESQLGPRKTQSVVAYVVSIRNTNVKGKAPQGEEER